MMEAFALQTLSSTAVSTILVGGLAFIFRSWISERLKNAIKNEYDEKLETHKAKLSAQNDVEIESLKSKLAIAANEHSVRYSRLHAKRADTIAEIYTLLVKAQMHLHMTVSVADFGTTTKAEKYQVARSSLADYYRYFNSNRIYLPERLCEKLEEFVSSMRDSSREFLFFVDHDEQPLSNEAIRRKNEAWDAASTYFDKELPQLRRALEEELRKILAPD